MAHVLIIEDEDALRTMLRAMLEQAGYTVTDAADGQRGVRAYQATPADVVLLDLFMPDQEGLETMRALRRLDLAVPIIAMSGGGRTGSMDFLPVAMAFGAQRTLRKPFARAELLAAIREVVRGDTLDPPRPPPDPRGP